MGRKRKIRQTDSAISEAIAQLTNQAKAECLLTGDANMKAVLRVVDEFGPVAMQEVLMLEMIERSLGGDRK